MINKIFGLKFENLSSLNYELEVLELEVEVEEEELEVHSSLKFIEVH